MNEATNPAHPAPKKAPAPPPITPDPRIITIIERDQEGRYGANPSRVAPYAARAADAAG